MRGQSWSGENCLLCLKNWLLEIRKEEGLWPADTNFYSQTPQEFTRKKEVNELGLDGIITSQDLLIQKQEAELESLSEKEKVSSKKKTCNKFQLNIPWVPTALNWQQLLIKFKTMIPPHHYLWCYFTNIFCFKILVRIGMTWRHSKFRKSSVLKMKWLQSWK